MDLLDLCGLPFQREMAQTPASPVEPCTCIENNSPTTQIECTGAVVHAYTVEYTPLIGKRGYLYKQDTF